MLGIQTSSIGAYRTGRIRRSCASSGRVSDACNTSRTLFARCRSFLILIKAVITLHAGSLSFQIVVCARGTIGRNIAANRAEGTLLARLALIFTRQKTHNLNNLLICMGTCRAGQRCRCATRANVARELSSLTCFAFCRTFFILIFSDWTLFAFLLPSLIAEGPDTTTCGLFTTNRASRSCWATLAIILR